jgi:hypothetical protein
LDNSYNRNWIELAVGGDSVVYLRYGDRLTRLDLPPTQ